ncbi:hypothetical protein EIP91_005930 [Steccherinum ochraceum]|uniref:Uncharacterized protein n=1 Tax=Steccherinum ochraceum TaxID=92696 RepID=A0A4R0RRI4_9APHY|nr:hypothetical protein EIP91_005930 [Steccherinum ochraceum]
MKFGSGLPHVLRSLAYLSPPVIVVVVASYAFCIPTWATILLSIASLPAYVASRIWYRYWDQRRRAAAIGAAFPPGYNGVKLGNLDLLVKLRDGFQNGYLADGFNDGHAKMGGTFNMRLLWDNRIVTYDANVIKAVLATDFSNFIKGERFRAYVYSVLGTGVFNADGDRWRFHRQMTRPFFSRDRISHFDIFEENAEPAITKMRERFREGHAVDFQDVVFRFTLDSASAFLFGTNINHLASALPYPPNSPLAATNDDEKTPAGRFSRAFNRAQFTIAGRGRIGYIWPFLEIFKDKTEDDMKIVNDFLNPIVHGAIEKYLGEKADGLHDKSDPEEVKDDETLLEHMVRRTTDPVILRDEILNILVAGRDTTAGTLTFAVYFMSMYPHTLQRLRKEILETVGPSRRPDYDDIKNMKYLRAFLNEVLRLYPAVPLNVRYAVKDTVLPNPDPNGLPFFVPAGAPVTYSVLLMQRRIDYWGEDAQVFDPDRWLDDRIKYFLDNPFIFLPFNGGPRMCIGQQFAYNEMSFFLIRLLQNFSDMELQLDLQTLPPKEWAQFPGRKGMDKFFPKAHLTAYAKDGLWVKMKEADSDAEA